MPRALVFAACEKGSIDHGSMLPSLIGVFHHFRVNVRVTSPAPDAPPEDIPPVYVDAGFVLAIPWCAMSYWVFDKEDAGKPFLIRCEMLKPDGMVEERLTDTAAVSLEAGARYSCQFNYSGIVYHGAGVYLLRLSIREDVAGGEWSVAAEYPLTVSSESWG